MVPTVPLAVSSTCAEAWALVPAIDNPSKSDVKLELVCGKTCFIALSCWVTAFAKNSWGFCDVEDRKEFCAILKTDWVRSFDALCNPNDPLVMAKFTSLLNPIVIVCPHIPIRLIINQFAQIWKGWVSLCLAVSFVRYNLRIYRNHWCFNQLVNINRV